VYTPLLRIPLEFHLGLQRPRRGHSSERVSSGPFYAVLALGRPGAIKGLTCIAGGATLPAEETLRFSGASVVASAGGLESDLKHARISPNSTYVNLVGILEQEMVLMALQLADIVDGLSSEERVEAAPILDDLATYLLEKHEHRNLEKVLRTVMEIRERCLPPGHPDLMSSRFRLADFLSGHDRKEEAMPIYERLVPSIQSIAHNHLTKHRIEEAVAEFQRALELKMVISDPNDPALARQFHELAEVCKENRHPAAEDLYRRALAIRELRVAEEPQPVIDTLYGLADTYRSRKLLAEAEILSRRALEMAEQLVGANSPALVPHLKLLAEVLKGLGRYGECTDLDSRAMLLKYRRA
jgi:tetratricopeptide (TPR) repeat protein